MSPRATLIRQECAAEAAVRQARLEIAGRSQGAPYISAERAPAVDIARLGAPCFRCGSSGPCDHRRMA